MEKDVADEIEEALFHIHAFASLLVKEASDNPEPASKNNEWSSERLSLAQIVVEKAELCLKTIDKNRTGDKAEMTT